MSESETVPGWSTVPTCHLVGSSAICRAARKLYPYGRLSSMRSPLVSAMELIAVSVHVGDPTEVLPATGSWQMCSWYLPVRSFHTRRYPLESW